MAKQSKKAIRTSKRTSKKEAKVSKKEVKVSKKAVKVTSKTAITPEIAERIVGGTALIHPPKRAALRAALVSHGAKWAIPYAKACGDSGWKFNRRLRSTVTKLIAS